MKDFNKKAESYGGGSHGSDALSTEDGSDTLQNEIDTNSPANGDGQGYIYDPSVANHPVTPSGEQGHYSDKSDGTSGAGKDQKPSNNEVVELPYGQEAVSDNHADGGYVQASRGLMSLFKRASDDEADFFTSKVSGGAADSPQKLNDGMPTEDVSIVQPVVNTLPNENGQSGYTHITDPGVIGKEKDDIADINKGNCFAHLKQHIPFISTISLTKKAITQREIDEKAKIIEDKANNTSNVSSVMYPDEERITKNKANNDFGRGNNNALNSAMQDAPYYNSDISEESKNYSGFDNTAGLLSLYAKKEEPKFPLKCSICRSTKNDIRGKICGKCAFAKKAEYTSLMPSTNPNSGNSLLDPNAVGAHGPAMSDGKGASESINNGEDKIDNDPMAYRKKFTYTDKVEDNDHYFNVLNTGGGFGSEGDGVNQSGVSN